MPKVGWSWRGRSIGKAKGGGKNSPPHVAVNCCALEVVLERELRNARSGSALTGDSSKGSTAADRAGGAWVVEDGVVQDVEILGPELHAGFAEDREGADHRAVPYREAGAAERVLDHVAESRAR